MKFNKGFKQESKDMQTYLQEEEKPLSYTFRLTKPPYNEALAICREAGITSYKQYLSFQKKNPHHKLPSYPSQSYKEWTSIYDFLGTVPRNNREWALYERSLKIKSGELVVERKPKKAKVQEHKPVVEHKPVEEQKPLNEVKDVQNNVISLLESGADFRLLFVKMTKHYNIFEECKDGIRTLFTYDELFKMVIK